MRADGRHGILNLLVAVSRALSDEDVHEALGSTDAEGLAEELAGLRAGGRRCPAAAVAVRRGPRPVPAAQLAGLGLLA